MVVAIPLNSVALDLTITNNCTAAQIAFHSILFYFILFFQFTFQISLIECFFRCDKIFQAIYSAIFFL